MTFGSVCQNCAIFHIMNPITAAMQKSGPERAQLGLRARKQNATRDAIWDSAISLFVEKGFDETTIEEIAEAAFVSPRSFFRYFESKNDLMAHPIAKMANSIDKAIASCPKTAGPAELLRYVVLVLTSESASDPYTAKVMKVVSKYPSASNALTSRIATVEAQIEQAFRRRTKDAVTVRVLSSLTVSALSLSVRHWYETGQKDIAASTRKVLSSIAHVAGGVDPSLRNL